MTNDIAEIFSLQGLRVTVITTTDTTITLKAKSPRRTADCTRCGARAHRIHQRRRRIVNHGQLNDKRIMVSLAVRRFLCKGCGRTFTEQLPGINRRLSTDRCLTRQLQDAATTSIKGTAERHDKAWASVAGLLDDIRYDIPWHKQGRRISLGIDEHSLKRRRQMVTTVTNLTRGRRGLLTILPNDKKETIVKFFKQLPDAVKARITEVCIDMRMSFRVAIEAGLPGVNIVADPFHVVQLAGRAVEAVREVVLGNLGRQPHVTLALRTPQEKLTAEERTKLAQLWEMTAPWPALKIAWQVKEKIRDLYHSRNRQSAAHKFALILAYLDGADARPLRVLHGTLVRWQEQILNHFDHRTTNGFTEGCHTKIKMLKRLSYGFRNRARYRTKILLGFHPVSEFISTTTN